jgi:hypothetical protein
VTVLKDSSLTRELVGYEQTEPGQRDNELHSIIGTEYPLLSPQLEAYYRQYFVSRQAVVADAQQFDQVFASYKQQIDDLHHQLMVMKRQMTLNQDAGRIQSYNAQVPRYNELVNQYNQLANEYNQLSRDLTQGEDLATTE